MKEKERKEKKGSQDLHEQLKAPCQQGGKGSASEIEDEHEKNKRGPTYSTFLFDDFPFFFFVTNKKVGVGGGVGTVLIVIQIRRKKKLISELKSTIENK